MFIWLHQWTREALQIFFWTSVKPFSRISQNILLSKLDKDWLDQWTVRWIRKWWDSHIQKVVVSVSESQWTSTTHAVTQGSILEPVFFNIFLNNTGEGIECTLRKFTSDTKLSGECDTTEGWDPFRWTWTNLRSGPWEHPEFRVLHYTL